ncbi:hypothetical protein [Streptomyces sp. NPDC091371]|uniref:hypothetical protein n=1 Tax=Streptomyces sp. NPDC091371 TaxID=3155303 RepID=UPI0034366C90
MTDDATNGTITSVHIAACPGPHTALDIRILGRATPSHNRDAQKSTGDEVLYASIDAYGPDGTLIAEAVHHRPGTF